MRVISSPALYIIAILFLTLQGVGQKLADAVKSGDSVIVELDFKESMAHPDDRYSVQARMGYLTDFARALIRTTQSLLTYRVEWEFWTSSNDACGAGCDRQSLFKSEFAETAISLEKVDHCFQVLPKMALHA